MATHGRYTLVQVSTGSNYSTVQRLRVGRVRMSGTNIDVSKMASQTEFHSRIQGLTDCTWVTGGLWTPTDINGQIKLFNAWKNDTALNVRILPAGSTRTYIEQAAKIKQFALRSTVNGDMQVYVEIDGSSIVDFSPVDCNWRLTLERSSSDIVASSTDIVGATTDSGCVIIELLFDV